MDVLHFTIIILSVSVLSSCGFNKSAHTVFIPPTNKHGPQSCLNKAIKNRFIVKWTDGHISTVKAQDKKTFFKNFVEPNLDKIELAEYDYTVKINDFIKTTDGLSLSSKSYHLNLIKAAYAWNNNIKGDGIIIAIIDTGVDTNHPQIRDSLHTNRRETPFNNRDDDGNGLIDDFQGYDFFNRTGRVRDSDGHGTHVSGIALASHNQGAAKGIAPNAKLLPLNFMGPDGSGRLSDAIEAIQYAVSQGAKIINASWGGPDCSSALKESIEQLGKKDVLFITASGNDGANLDDHPTFPAAFEISSQITVGASNEEDFMANYSNYSFNKTHLVAPGSNIYSTLPGGGASLMSGTSMAAPIVSGSAALLWSRFPSATSRQIKQALLDSVDIGLTPSPVVSNGRLNIERALQSLDAALR